MILFFGSQDSEVFALDTNQSLSENDIQKLTWLFSNMPLIDSSTITQEFIGPRANMVTPWSTNAVEITQNMGISGIARIERFTHSKQTSAFDPMLNQKFKQLDQNIFHVSVTAQAVINILDIEAYNKEEGLALSQEEIDYLEDLSNKLNRPLTDSEVFGFSQVNSEHCRHKIFNGQFIIDGEEKAESLFKLIKKTSSENPNDIVSAYKDNVAFIQGPESMQFAPSRQDTSDYYERKSFESVISLKAETHNFPTTVEPFNGAATGSGGEIRDRMAGGKGAIPLAGTALYMTAYPRLGNDRKWENKVEARQWLYQSPLDILIKASNGASDFGNKFGQPLINGSLFTFEHLESGTYLGYDKVIMLAGGIGYGKKSQALKDKPKPGDKIVILGGDNYRIGMGGAAVSSADTGEFSSGIELNAVQRSNPEMQKRVCNAVRSMVESDQNPIISIHDHGAGGHLNCLSELVEETGGRIELDNLPIGDLTLSAKEIIGNESQERMGLVIASDQMNELESVASRERAPFYVVGEVTGDHHFSFVSNKLNQNPIDLQLENLFGNSPKTIMRDHSVQKEYSDIHPQHQLFNQYLKDVLRIESVACKDWLTNKVDRCVGGKVAMQQCTGALQLPLNNCGISAIDFESKNGIATSMGHAPLASLIDPAKGSRMAILEALTNIVWAPLKNGLSSVSLSANWMWPCNNEGEDARLYEAVKAVSDFAIDLGINIPTGKDSLSMKQKYSDKEVIAPGTVVISATGHCIDITKAVSPNLQIGKGDIFYINLSSSDYKLGASSLAQVNNLIGSKCPDTAEAKTIRAFFDTLQDLIQKDKIKAGHDVSSGGLITTLLESCFSSNNVAAALDLTPLNEKNIIQLLFSENNGVILQSDDEAIIQSFATNGVRCIKLGKVIEGQTMYINNFDEKLELNIPELRDVWYETSYLFDQHQTAAPLAFERFNNYKNQALKFSFPQGFNGVRPERNKITERPKAAVIREKGSNSERELAHAMYLAGFDVKDVHMTDLVSGREDLKDIQFLGAVGGFSNSDVLGSAKGWAGAFMYNEKAKKALDDFFKRPDVISVGICNGCQLLMELELINPDHKVHGKMTHNDSKKHESIFTSVKVENSNSVMLHNLAGTTLGVWVSHGEGKFVLPGQRSEYNIVATYAHDAYPSNPNGSDYNTAMMCSDDGRHLVMMPHIERSLFKWNWAHYPDRDDDVSPWIQAFINAREWCISHK